MRRSEAEVEGGDLGDAGHRLRAEMAGEPGEAGRVGGAGHVGVDGDFDQVRAGDIGGGLDEDGGEGDAGLQLVGEEIGEQAAHEAAVVGLARDIVGGKGLLLGFFGLLVFLG